MIKHYLARDRANPVEHILNSLILPLFTTPTPSAPSPPPTSIVVPPPPPPSSTKKRGRDDNEEGTQTDPLTEEVDSEGFTYLEMPSVELGGGRSRKQRKRRPKSKTRRKRSLLNHNLTR